MEVIPDLASLRRLRRQPPPINSLGLVPTMGALHEGHASLVRRSVAENDRTAVSIFVNPTQFGPNEDFARYPRTMEADLALLKQLGVDWVFAPDHREIYPAAQQQIGFTIRELDKVLCGASRPGHMNGVLQVVSILFHLVQPDRAYFGRKDYQQYLIIRQMVQELHMQLEVVPCEIVREADGLAMSSRNRYLNPEERQQALYLSRTLTNIQARAADWSSPEEIIAFARETLAEYPLVELDYFELRRGDNLETAVSLDPADQPHLFVAAWLGKTRLIDNAPLWAQD